METARSWPATSESPVTVRRYLDTLTDALTIRQPQPWYATRKRQTRPPKVYVHDNGARAGVEVKRTDRPRLTPSMRQARDDLVPDRIIAVHAGRQGFPSRPRIEAVPAQEVLTHGLPSG